MFDIFLSVVIIFGIVIVIWARFQHQSVIDQLKELKELIKGDADA